jgi:hypothetical protein
MPFSDEDAVQATQRAMQAEAHGGGTMRDIVPPDARKAPVALTHRRHHERLIQN